MNSIPDNPPTDSTGIEAMFNLERYPIPDLLTGAGGRCAHQCRQTFGRIGIYRDPDAAATGVRGRAPVLAQIRSLSNEAEQVAGVLDGNREGVVKLPFTAGTLLLFGGRQTIHRVTRVKGPKPRQ